MYSFIIAQENILQCEEYELFTKKTLSSIRSFSDRKTESMAYLYNNQKLKITVENQFEKDKMMKKLVMVNRQVKKWNTTVFNKSTSKEELEEETRKALAPKEETKEHTKIHEVDEDLEDEKLSSAAPGETSRGQTVVIAEAERQTKDKIRREKELAKEKERNEMTKSQLIRALVKEKCNIIWKVIILTTRYCTNQILLVFSFDKLDEIFEDVKLGETRVYTHIEEKLYEDYKANEKIRDEQELELIEDIDPSEIHKEAEKAMSLVKMLLSLYILLINMILSNTEFFCYLTMIICMIMNGSILSLVYPISIFIYALLEEKRPRKGYWLFILNYTAIVLILKFLFQTYPFSTWIVSDWVSPENDSITPLINSANDFLMALRFGLENLDESGRNFVKFFFFECLILLTVTLHILILIFGGVWTQREIEAESIDAAANRIATNKAIDKQKILMLEKRKEAEEKNGDIQDSFKTESFFDSNEFRNNDDVSVYPPDHKKIFRRRAYSMNNCTEMRQVAYDINEYNEIDSDVLEDRLEEWRQIEEEFAYGGTKFEDYLEMNCKDQITKEKEKLSYEQFQYEYRKELRGIRNDWIMRNRNNRGFDGLKASERSVTFYHYKEPEFEECKDFVIKNKAGESKLAQLLMKIKIALTRSKYFESLFPTIKEQKPGIDLYAPMVVFQVVVIVFMIFFFTRMHPDNTGISPESLTPTTFSNLMVLFVFLQIIVIVLDRYLYLSRDYVVIDEVELEEYDEEASDEDVGRSESISQFDRTSSFDLRSSSANKLLVKGIKSSQQMKMKGKSKETKNLDEEVEEEYEDDDGGDVQLSKTKFNQTLLIKYYLQLALLIIVHILVFWYFPIAANMGLMSTPFCQFGDSVGSECNEVFMNWTLVVFYLLYCGYFFFSALQIRYGLPELRKGNFSMNGYTGINKGMFMGFMSAPFVFELKIIADWTFTRTALDLFQWIKFESIYGDLFVAKCSNKPIMAHPLGKKVPAFMKMVMGCGGLIALIVIIAGPLLLFSALNPLANPNPVLGASLTLNIITNLTSEPGGATNVYQLFNTDNFITVEPISDANYRSISGIRLIRNLDRAQFQQVQLSDVADTSWVISPPAREKLFERIRSAKEDGQTDLPINIELIYAFDRAEPAGQQRVDKPLPIVNILDKNVFGRDDILQKLYTAINPETP